MKVIIDMDLCIGCGTCQEICPAVFHLDEVIGKAEVMDAEACEYGDAARLRKRTVRSTRLRLKGRNLHEEKA